MIPRIFHRIWLDEPIPEPYEMYWERLQELHPGWEFRTWTDGEHLASLLQNRELFERLTTPPESYGFRSDIARYEILDRFGGIYVDTDVEPLRSLEPLLGDDPFIAWCSDAELDPSIMGSPPGHPAIRDLVDGLGDVTRWVASGRKVSPPGSTGPVYVTGRWRSRDDVRRLPPRTFFPYHWSDKEPGHARPPWPSETLAVHHWAAGWKPPVPGTVGRAATAG